MSSEFTTPSNRVATFPVLPPVLRLEGDAAFQQVPMNLSTEEIRAMVRDWLG